MSPASITSPAERLSGILPDVEIAVLEPLIEEIEELKQQRRAVVLAHNYMTPDIYHGVADLTGDSLALARMAGETDAEVIIMAGVHFMAETAKIVNEQRTVLIRTSSPDARWRSRSQARTSASFASAIRAFRS